MISSSHPAQLSFTRQDEKTEQEKDQLEMSEDQKIHRILSTCPIFPLCEDSTTVETIVDMKVGRNGRGKLSIQKETVTVKVVVFESEPLEGRLRRSTLSSILLSMNTPG